MAKQKEEPDKGLIEPENVPVTKQIAPNEVDAILKDAETQAQNIIDAANHVGDVILKEAQDKALIIVDAAQKEAETIITQATERADKIIEQAEEKAISIVENSRNLGKVDVALTSQVETEDLENAVIEKAKARNAQREKEFGKIVVDVPTSTEEVTEQ